MKLTGKCKEDFEKWLYKSNVLTLNILHSQNIDVFEKEKYFYKLSDSMQYGVYVDFFDSVELFPNVIYSYNVSMQGCNWFSVRVDNKYVVNGLKTRQEARTQAITKANEIYNQ